MKSFIKVIGITAALVGGASMIGVSLYGLQHNMLPWEAAKEIVNPKTPAKPKELDVDSASIICYSLLKDFSEDDVMANKVKEVIRDGNYTDDDCHVLIDFHNEVKKEEERRRKREYLKDAKVNVGI